MNYGLDPSRAGAPAVAEAEGKTREVARASTRGVAVIALAKAYFLVTGFAAAGAYAAARRCGLRAVRLGAQRGLDPEQRCGGGVDPGDEPRRHCAGHRGLAPRALAARRPRRARGGRARAARRAHRGRAARRPGPSAL